MRNAEEDKSCETIIKRSERGQQGKKFPYLHDTGLVGGNYPLLPLEILVCMVAALLHLENMNSFIIHTHKERFISRKKLVQGWWCCHWFFKSC
jgi:hypothetical protein